MRGSPLLRALAAFVVLFLVHFPVYWLTHPTVKAKPLTGEETKAELKAIRLHLEFTAAPARLRVLHLGSLVWEVQQPGFEAEKTIQIPFPSEGVDLQFQIGWPAEARVAARVRLTTPEGAEIEKTIWSAGEADEVVTFP